MSEVLKANIFFFISSVAIILITILIVVVLFYIISIVRNIKKTIKSFRKQAELVVKDIGKVRETMSKGSNLGYIAGFVKSFFEEDSPRKKK